MPNKANTMFASSIPLLPACQQGPSGARVTQQGLLGGGQKKAYLHRPEVKGEEEEDDEEAGDEAFAEPVADEVGHDGAHTEEEVEKGGQRVPGKEPPQNSGS